MLITGDTAVFERATMLRDQGRSPAGRKKLFNEAIGFKYRMSSLQAAFGLAQLERLDDLVAKKRQIFHWYKSRLANVGGISLNAEPEGILNTFWMVTPVWDHSFGASKEDVIDRMGEAGFDTRPFFYPLSSLPAFSHLVDGATMLERNPVAYDLSSRAINLPCGLSLTEEQADGAAIAFLAAIGAA
jgi:perosamine synthetase